MKEKVLFICVHNSARSQMAEAFLNKIAAEKFMAESAGIEPGALNPVVVEVMKEVGIDISHHKSKSVDDLMKQGKIYDYVITVCDEASAEKCPVFPGKAKKIHMGFPDPSGFTENYKKKLIKTREVRDQIKQKIESWVEEMNEYGTN